MLNRNPKNEFLSERAAVPLLIIRLLEIACLSLFLMIVADVFMDIMRTGPPPVPLDPQGQHFAPDADYIHPGS